MSGIVRQFATGATRDTDNGKPDYEGFLSPRVLKEFGRYMSQHQRQSDGSLRASDNWQKGIPRDAYVKSLFRHFMDLWFYHRGLVPVDHLGNTPTLMDTLMAILFNVQGYAHESLKEVPEKKDTAQLELPFSDLSRIDRMSEDTDEDFEYDRMGTRVRDLTHHRTPGIVNGVPQYGQPFARDFGVIEQFDAATDLNERYVGEWNNRSQTPGFWRIKPREQVGYFVDAFGNEKAATDSPREFQNLLGMIDDALLVRNRYVVPTP